MKFDSLNFSIDEGSYCWSLSGQVTDIEDWTQATPGKEIKIQIGEDEYIFIIDSRERTEEFSGSFFSITARSKTSLYGVGAPAIYKTWGNTTAHAVILELVPDAVITIPDWNFPEELLTIEGDTPISIISTIATACGGILYSDSKGILHVVPKYKVAPADYSLDLVDHSWSDLDHILKLNETYEISPGYNQVTVSDEPDDVTESVVTITEHSKDLLNLSAVIKIVTFPFVSSLNLLTSQLDVTISSSTLVEEEITEDIEIIDGIGTVKAPIFELLFTSYLGTNLDILKHTGLSVESTIMGTTLVRVTYITQYHFVTITTNTSKKVQLFTLDDTEGVI